ncbi:MAG: hypothetical protein AB8I08_00670 [Sandaracinaceae bacterium]
MRWFWLIAAHCLLLLPTVAEAQLTAPGATHDARGRDLGRSLGDPRLPSAPSTSWAFDLSVASSLPLGWELEAQATAPEGFFVRASAGHMPSPYLEGVASALGDAEVYRPRLRPVVDDVVANGAWTVRAAVGWTAFDGLELALGYTLLAAETGMRPNSVAAALNTSVRFTPGMDSVPLTVRLHAVSGRVGWRALLDEMWTLRVALGWTHTFAVDTELDVPAEMRERDGDPASTLESRLADGLREYGFTPEVSLALGVRFR